jgi:hypothetical protein
VGFRLRHDAANQDRTQDEPSDCAAQPMTPKLLPKIDTRAPNIRGDEASHDDRVREGERRPVEVEQRGEHTGGQEADPRRQDSPRQGAHRPRQAGGR